MNTNAVRKSVHREVVVVVVILFVVAVVKVVKAATIVVEVAIRSERTKEQMKDKRMDERANIQTYKQNPQLLQNQRKHSNKEHR